MLVLAGAGTGKTSVLVERIAWLIEQQHAAPEEILAITFTENAAGEMKERVEKRLRRKTAISASTFNAYCQRVLQRCGKDFQVMPPEDVYVFLRQRIEELGLERFIRPADLGEFLYDLRNFFDRCHEELVSPEKFQQYIDCLKPGLDLPRNCKSKVVEELGGDEILARWQEIARVYANSMRLLEQRNLGTFGMQISKAVSLLQNDATLLEKERKRARFILIDEFQDCNSSNITLAELLGGDEKNIFAVGDPDQAIYRFRGASSAAFQEFQKRFPDTKGVVLDENQRSRGNILQVAFAAIHVNPDFDVEGSQIQFQRAPLQSARDLRDRQEGRLVFDEPVEVALSASDACEAADIAEDILRLYKTKGARERLSMAILYRNHLHRERTIEELAARDIPFIVKGMDVLDTSAVRDVLAVAGAVAHEGDADSLFRVCATPHFALDAHALRARLTAAKGRVPFKTILAELEAGRRVLAEIETARIFIAAQNLTATEALIYLMEQFDLPSGDLAVKALMRFTAEWEKKPYFESHSLAVLIEYLRLFVEGGGMVPLLTDDQLEEAAARNPDAVQLMTVHGAKGLEFSHVWLLRVVSNSFPNSFRESLFEFPSALRGSIATGESKDVNDQEERRLFYVAISRARDRLTICSRPGKGKDPTPPGYLRPLLQSKALAPILRSRNTSERGRETPALDEVSGVASWLLLPPAFNAEEIALSANAVDSYSTCPLKFKLERDWKIPGEVAAALQYGNAVHTVLRHYYDPAPNASLQTVEDVLAAFRKEFDKAVVDDPVQRELYETQGEKHLKTLVAARPRDSVDVLATEASFRFSIGKLTVVGRIDRLDRLKGNAVRVVDYKTGQAKTQKAADDSLQLSIYAMGAQHMELAPQELVFLNVKNNEEVVTTRSGSQLGKAREKIEKAADGIAAHQFEPRPGLHCRWCDYERLCPATEQRVLVPVRALTAGVNG
jgi:DNA helicase-2/ATP-dependent DNA helicase PcrA